MDFKAVLCPGCKGLTKTLRIMRLIAFLMLSTCLMANARGLSQGVTLSVRNAPLEKVFSEISRQTGYEFLYSMKMIQGAKKVDLAVKNANVSDVLMICFRNQPFSYTIIDRTIIIKPREQMPVEEQEISIPPVIVQGRVLDEKGQPLFGATVDEKGKSNSTTTGADGRFSLEVSGSESVLTISFVGYKTMEVKVGNQTSIEVG